MHGSQALRYGLVALLVATGLWFLVAQPWALVGPAGTTGAATGTSIDAHKGSGETHPRPSSTDVPSTSTTRAPVRSRPSTASSGCRAGVPARLIIPALGVDAAFERIGLDRTAPPDAQGKQPLGSPIDRTRAGWYAGGPRPGGGSGTVLTNGHTYRNNSAIFKEDFASRIALGQLIHVRQDNGSLCSYRVSRVWREVDAARDYPRIVSSQKLYNFSGPERLFLTTCGGSWNAFTQNYDDISLLIASPVNRG
ncbi:class F sortase [Terrabacter sp. GCM10028922]|uniref:class F sortase n=1 Tax=Terrabacter sp. GCM10028922 TaxID=3273428 RepID=UPI003609463A